MPTWTAPKSWQTDELVTAVVMNSNIRDNLIFLKTPPQDFYNVGAYGGASTTSTSFVNIDATNVSLDITTAGGRIVGVFQALCYRSTNAEIAYFDISIDGARIGETTYGLGGYEIGAAGIYYQISLPFITAPQTAAAHNIKVLWRSAGGNQINIGANILYHVWEV